MTTKTLCLTLLATACLDAEAPEVTSDLDQEARTTTPGVLPNRIVLGQLDDSAGTNLLQYDQHRLFVTRTDYAGTPVMHHYFRANIAQLIVGDFALPGSRESGRDQVCALLADNSLECYAPSDDRTQLWWWFTQGNPLLSDEQAIVGDFTGDGADDILAFSPFYGSVRLLSRTSNGFAVAPFAIGNLSNVDLRGKRLLAGEFGQATNRADLLVVDPSTGVVRRYDSVTDTSGRTTFWWAFTTGAGTLASSEQVTVANIEGGSRDGLLLRDPATGRVRAMRAEYGSGYLAPVPATAVSLGQIPVTSNSATLVAARLPSTDTEPGGALRDDVLFFDRTQGTVAQISARHDGTRMTYWWAYTKATPVQSGWGPRRDTSTAIVLCKLADVSDTPDTALIRKRLVERGQFSVRDYLFEISYGTIDIANATVTPWVTSNLRAADSSARVKGGKKTADYIASCLQAANLDGAAFGGRVLVVLNDTNVAFQGINYYGAAVDYRRVVDGSLSAVTHELLHAFGLAHAHDDSGASCGGEYCDTSDLMGNFYSSDLETPDGSWGPELNAAHRERLDVVPAARTIDLDASSAPASTTITLAPLEQPEAQGTLMVTLQTATDVHYTIALRRSVGLDANTGVDGVQIHRVDPANPTVSSTLLVTPARTLVAGHVASVAGFTIRIDSLDADARRAVITVTR